MDETALEKVYQENLEERIISCLARQQQITLESAMDIYYRSQLANKIHQGVEGIQYLDFHVLVDILCETEKDLLSHGEPDPFYSKENMEWLQHSIKELEEGKVITKTIKELQAMVEESQEPALRR